MISSSIDVAGDAEVQQLLAVWRQFDDCAQVEPGLRLGFGARAINLSDPRSMRLAGPAAIRGVLRVEPAGMINVGKWAYLGDATIVSSASEVTIGEGTLLAHGVQVFDNSTHPINGHRRQQQFMKMLGDTGIRGPFDIDTAPVHIGARCWIGMNSLVMRGVTIGEDTIVAAGSVVTKSLPARVVAGGNPCVPLRNLEPEEFNPM